MKNQKEIKSLLYALITTSPVIGITVVFVIVLLQNLSEILESVVCGSVSILILCGCWSLVGMAYDYFYKNWE